MSVLAPQREMDPGTSAAIVALRGAAVHDLPSTWRGSATFADARVRLQWRMARLAGRMAGSGPCAADAAVSISR